MGLFNNFMGRFKGSKDLNNVEPYNANNQNIVPENSGPLIQGGVQTPSTFNTLNQNSNPIIQGINQERGNAEPNALQSQDNNSNRIANVLKRANPNNWQDSTRQTAANILLGIGNSTYDPKSGVFASLANGANKGLQNQIAYNNAKNVLGQYGIDPDSLSPYVDYSGFTSDKLIGLGIQQRKQQTAREIAQAKDKTTQAKMIIDGFNKGILTAEEAQAQLKIRGIDINNLQDSNETLKTKSQIEVNNARIEKIKADIKQNAQKISILQQRVALGRATAGEKAILNQLNIENKKLIIEQNKLINQAMQQAADGGGQTPRPVGSSNAGRTKVF